MVRAGLRGKLVSSINKKGHTYPPPRRREFPEQIETMR
jgi:hypothetical protein